MHTVGFQTGVARPAQAPGGHCGHVGFCRHEACAGRQAQLRGPRGMGLRGAWGSAASPLPREPPACTPGGGAPCCPLPQHGKARATGAGAGGGAEAGHGVLSVCAFVLTNNVTSLVKNSDQIDTRKGKRSPDAGPPETSRGEVKTSGSVSADSVRGAPAVTSPSAPLGRAGPRPPALRTGATRCHPALAFRGVNQRLCSAPCLVWAPSPPDCRAVAPGPRPACVSGL